MFKLKFYLIIIFFSITCSLSSAEKVFIAVSIDNKIITNIDIQKEYFKNFKPSLLKLDNKSKYEIAKKSLINEKIKKEEIIKFTDFKRNNPLEDAMLKNLYDRVNLSQEDFKNVIKKKIIALKK